MNTEEPRRLYVTCRDIGFVTCCPRCHAVMAQQPFPAAPGQEGGQELIPLQKASWLRRVQAGWRPRVMTVGYFCCTGFLAVEQSVERARHAQAARGLWAHAAREAKYQYRRRC